MDYERPVWTPLVAVVGALAEWFMWMHEVRLADGAGVHAYKHRTTRRYLHLDTEGHAYVYESRPSGATYRGVGLAVAVADTFHGWTELLTPPSAAEQAQLSRAIHYAEGLPDGG